MKSMLRPALVLLGLFTLLTGVAYPLAVTGFAQMLFPVQANGSLVRRGDEVVGSELIGQCASDPGLFWGRASATTPAACNAGGSGGSNLGPSNPALHEAIAARVLALKRASPPWEGPIPVDLLTTSASGLDPHLSPAGVHFQVPRVARARGMPEETVRALVAAHLEPRTFGVLGESRVNVLKLNLALLRLADVRKPEHVSP